MMEFGFTRKRINPVRRLIIWLEGLRPGPGKVETPREHSSRPLANSGLNLNIMSFNIRRGTREDGRNHWVFRRPLVREVLERDRPDVLGLQEALDFQIAALRTMLPGYEKVGTGNLGGSRGLHTAIFYDATRFTIAESGTVWFSPTPDIPSSKGWGNVIPRTCTWARLMEKDSHRAFYCYNVHLDHLSQRSRKKSAVFMSRLIQTRRFPDPFVLTGDFNAREENTAIRFLKGNRHLGSKADGYMFNPEPLKDTFRDRYPDHPPAATYHGFRRFFFRFKFDYIFVPASVQVREAKIIQLRRRKCFPSDHFPLFSRIVFPATYPN